MRLSLGAKLFKSISAMTLALAISSAASAAPETTFDSSRFLSVSEIPANLSEWLYHEQLVNNRFTGTIFAPLDHSALDPRFDPMARSVVLMGYLEIPRAKANVRVDEAILPASARRVLFFKRDGIEYVRMFIHPLMEEKYRDEAKLYGQTTVDSSGKKQVGLKYGEFAATLSSSMRSWVIWNRAQPGDFIGEKTSIAVVVGMDRKNDVDKLERAAAITQVTKEIPAEAKARFGFDLFTEPVTQNTATIPGGKHFGNITRVFPEMSYSDGKPRLIPGFSLTSFGPNGETPLLARMIVASGLPAEEFIAQKIIGPLVRSYAYLTFEHGIIGEPHQQNVLFEIDPQGRLTGRVFYRDLDAFKPDIELRHLRGLSDEPFLNAKRPFKLLKMAKAEHDYRRSYMSYVKGAWTESIENMIGQTKAKIPMLASVKGLSERFDKALLVELVGHFGFEAVFDAANMAASERVESLEWMRENKDPKYDAPSLEEARKLVKQGTLDAFIAGNLAKLQVLEPSVRWTGRPLHLTQAQAEKVIGAFTVNELFLRNYANDARTYIFDVNRVVEKFKSSNVPKAQASMSQSVLRKEYERLAFNYRASSIEEVPRSGHFVLNKGSITAISSTGNVLGHAFLEPRAMLKVNAGYYADSKYPRVEPNRVVLAQLYKFADGKLAKIPDIETLSYKFPGAAVATVAAKGAAASCSHLFSR